jgi:hypothetical protein
VLSFIYEIFNRKQQMKKLLLLMILYCNVVLPTWQDLKAPLILFVPASISAIYNLHDAREKYSSNDRKTVRAKLNYGFKILTSSATLVSVTVTTCLLLFAPTRTPTTE